MSAQVITVFSVQQSDGQALVERDIKGNGKISIRTAMVQQKQALGKVEEDGFTK